MYTPIAVLVLSAILTVAQAKPTPEVDDYAHHNNVKLYLKDGATKAIEASLRAFLHKAEAVKKVLVLKAVDKTIDGIRKWLIEPKKAAVLAKALPHHHEHHEPVHHETVHHYEPDHHVPKKVVHVPDYFNVYGYGRK